MDKYTKDILNLLKASYEKVAGIRPYQTESEARAYYLKNLNDNFYQPMSEETAVAYGSGSGNEIASGKMNALRSSSAMTYNLLGNGPVDIFRPTCSSSNSTSAKHMHIGEGCYRLEYEKQLPTLKASASNRPANLDAFLYCEKTNEAVACEMKMTEWIFNKPGQLKNKYLDPSNYMNEEAGKIFTKIAEELILWNDYDAGESLSEAYPCRMSRYDAFQMFKHTIALFNACSQNEHERIKRLTLVNCVWMLPNPGTLSDKHCKRYRCEENTEHKEFREFKEAMSPANRLFSDIGVDFEIEFYSFNEFLSILKKDANEKAYLKRYALL